MPASSPSRRPASTSTAKSSARSGGPCCCRPDPRTTAPVTFPLAGVRVVDMATVVAGPGTAKYIADFGADVIKVEAPSGDPARRLGWTAAGRHRLAVLEDSQPRQALRHARPQVARRPRPDEAAARLGRRADREHASRQAGGPRAGTRRRCWRATHDSSSCASPASARTARTRCGRVSPPWPKR